MPHLELSLGRQLTRNYVVSLPTYKWTDSPKVDILTGYLFLFRKIQVPSGQDAYESSVFSLQRNLFGKKIYNQMSIQSEQEHHV